MYILRDHKWTPMDLPPRLKKWILPATAEPLRIPLRSYILAHYPPEIITILNFMIIIPLLFILVLQSSYISLNDVYLFKTYVNSLTHTACVLLWLLFNITFETHPLMHSVRFVPSHRSAVWQCVSAPQFTFYMMDSNRVISTAVVLLLFSTMNNTAKNIPVYNSWVTHARPS